ncbi:MAG: DUF4383 domain-containing protein [Candidatus Peribacteraceae bacterium]|nr:DUF4383 domain-containing protein [Candidatus Peribacteraceae bacterium]
MGALVSPLTRILGVVFVLIGVLGFFMSSPLLGIFEVDTIHNVIHLASGVVALVVGGNHAMARLYLIIFGLVYAAVALIGYMQGTTVLGIFPVNDADNILHAVIGAACLVVGFGSKS